MIRTVGRVLHGILRVLAWIFLVVVVAAAGLGWWAYKRFSPENARRLATEQLTAVLRREVVIDKLVLSPRGVKVVGLRVRRGRPGGEADLLACDSALVTIKLKPLLQRRLEFESVILQSPRITLVRDADGIWDLADVFGSSRASVSPAALPLALAAAETEVRDGLLRFDDRLRGRKLSFERLDLRIDGFAPDKNFPVEVSLRTSETIGGRTVSADVAASGVVDLAGLNWSSATARADRLTAEVAGVSFSGRATLTSFSPPRLEADISAPALGPAQWRALLGRDWTVTVPPTRWRAKAGLPAPAMIEVEKLAAENGAGSASLSGLFDLGADTPTLSVDLSVRDADLARVGAWSSSWAAHGLSGKATLRASVTGSPGRLQAREAELTLKGFGAAWDGRAVQGVDLEAAAANEFSRLKATVTKGRARLIGNDFEDLAFVLSLDRQSLAIESLAFRWGGSKVRLRARVEHPSAPKEVVISGGADKVDWNAAARLVADVRAAISTRTAAAPDSEDRPWLRTFKYSIPRGFPDTVGHVHVGEIGHANFWCKDVDLIWTLRGVTPALDKVAGEARLRFGPGRVNDIPAVQESNPFLRVVFIPFVYMQKMNNLSVFSTNTAYPKTMDFALIDGEYGATRGAATTRYFHVDSPQLVAYAEGLADFGREKVDMDILTRLTSYRGTLPEWWVDEAGRPAIGFRVKGDINKPDLEPRFKKIGSDEIERKVQEGQQRARKRFEALEKLQTL